MSNTCATTIIRN